MEYYITDGLMVVIGGQPLWLKSGSFVTVVELENKLANYGLCHWRLWNFGGGGGGGGAGRNLTVPPLSPAS